MRPELSHDIRGIDAINISNVLHHIEVASKFQLYHQNSSVTVVFYIYTRTFVPEVFNYKQALMDLALVKYLKKNFDMLLFLLALHLQSRLAMVLLEI